MYFEINVAKRRTKKYMGEKDTYSHFFATHERSLTNKQSFETVLYEFIEKFPFPDYKISYSFHREAGIMGDVEENIADLKDFYNQCWK